MNKQTFGEFVRTLREKRGIGQRQFAAKAEINHALWCRIETGRGAPPSTIQFFEKVINALEIEEGCAEWWQLYRLAHRPDQAREPA
jgi:transcriptional regulator with XRE-family HTH domain